MLSDRLINRIKPFIPPQVRRWITLDSFRYFPRRGYPYQARKELTERIAKAGAGIDCRHLNSEILSVIRAVLDVPKPAKGVIVEAGCFKGGSTAKLSVAAQMTGRELVVFDSFQGLPEVPLEERHNFFTGEYVGTLDEVTQNVQQYGAITACKFVPGWFSDTLPAFDAPVVIAFVDVDLRGSLKTCLEYLYPLLVPGGSIFAHDGHIKECVDLMGSRDFWHSVPGPQPRIYGLGKKKLVQIQKREERC